MSEEKHIPPPPPPHSPTPRLQKANLIIGIREKKQSKDTGLHIPSQTKKSSISLSRLIVYKFRL